MNNWPVEYADQLIVGNLDSNVAVCCLWSRKESVAAKLSPNQYCAIGNLYSRAGINPMLRNLFANPKIRFLLLTGISLTDSKEALTSFFDNGVDANWRIVGNGGQIDYTFPIEELDKLRESVRVVDAGYGDLEAHMPKVQLGEYAEPKLFPRAETTPQVYPSEHSGLIVRGRNIIEVWTAVIGEIYRFGRIMPTDYGVNQKELLNVLTIIEEPQDTTRELPDWAPFGLEAVRSYVERFFARTVTVGVSYGYGERLQTHWSTNQIFEMISDLRRASFSRRAVATLWDPVVDSRSPDPPCLVTIQLAIREQKIFVTAYIRSNDMFRAYPLNVAALAHLQKQVGTELDLGSGSISVLSHSAHIYADCWDACARASASDGPATFVQDPRGSFVFSARNNQLFAEHYSVAGDLIQTLSAADGRILLRKLRQFVSRIDHAMYLGREIDRLQRANETHSSYVQDGVS